MRGFSAMVLVTCCLSTVLLALQTTTQPYQINSTPSTTVATALQKDTRSEKMKINCGGVINADDLDANEGVITSPNYPGLYPQGLNCRWTIKAGKGMRVKLHFEDMDVTETDACRDDYLAASSQGAVLGDGSPSSPVGQIHHGRFCGTQVPKDIVSGSDVMQLEFRTSSTGETCRGFFARFSFEEVVSSCGEEISSLEFDFVNSEYPSQIANQSTECHLEISHDCDIKICQIRLDFVEFVLQPPTLGECLQDKFMVRGNHPPPVICGINSGQHVYVDVKGRTSTKIHVILSPIYPKQFGHSDEDDPNYNHTYEYLYEIQDNRKWKIRVEQIPCECQDGAGKADSTLAPVGCLQYHEALKGSIVSMNFEGTKQDLDPCWMGNETECNSTVWTGHLNNLDYNVCIKRAEGHCGVKYSAKGENSFLLSGGVDAKGHLTKVSLFGSSNCRSDYLGIPNSWIFGSEKKIRHDRYCGTAFGIGAWGVVISFSPPFQIRVKTDRDEFAAGIDIGNRGFYLEYTLIPCSSLKMYIK